MFLFFADAYHGREPTGEYNNNMDAFNAINCLDYAAAEKTLEQATAEAESSPKTRPSSVLPCRSRPGATVGLLNQWSGGDTVAEGSDPIVVTI